MRTVIVILILLALAGGGGWYWWSQQHKETQRSYKTVKAERGLVVQTVKATGILQPVLTIQVGTQVNGPVKKLYVDYNDHVTNGQVVAQIDPVVYQAHLAQDQANLLQNMAAVDEATAKLLQANQELTRDKELAKRELLSQSDLDAAVATRDALAAGLNVAQANVAQAKASLQLSQANLSYTTINSPVDGVIIARNVDEGQTVVASMTAQTLFQIGTDLRHMQVLASIPEADIGMVHTNQPVVFNVDAFEQEFTGAVAQIRLAASTVQNVVTYPVIISAENPAEKLFPGMTANISCEVGRHENSLRVPNAALRFKPEGLVAVSEKDGGGMAPASSFGGGQRSGGSRGGGEGGSHAGKPKNTIWVLDATNQQPRAVFVRVGLNDGAYTEVKEPSKLEEGADIITGYATEGAAQNGGQTVNPFAPKMGGPRPR